MVVKTVKRFWLDAIVIGSAMGGSALVAAKIGIEFIIMAYVLFLINCLSSIALLHKTKGAKSLTIVNLYFVVINIVGIYRYST